MPLNPANCAPLDAIVLFTPTPPSLASIFIHITPPQRAMSTATSTRPFSSSNLRAKEQRSYFALYARANRLFPNYAYRCILLPML